MLCCGTSRNFAQTVNTAKLNSLFTAIDVNNKGMGSIAIAKNGVIVYKRSIGYSSIDAFKKVPNTAQTEYRIGSITNMFTATTVFQLVGKVN